MKKLSFFKILAVIILVFLPAILAAEENKEFDEDKRMEITGLVFDENLQTPVVLLTDKEQSSVLPIWIGLCEARSIELGRSGIVAPRPLTYDLIAAIVRTLEAKVDRIVIVDIRDEVYYAQVEVSVGGKVSKIDARPSDALALASRMNSPIYVKKTVLEKAALPDPEKEKKGL